MVSDKMNWTGWARKLALMRVGDAKQLSGIKLHFREA
jgi:hypothetical protein